MAHWKGILDLEGKVQRWHPPLPPMGSMTLGKALPLSHSPII